MSEMNQDDHDQPAPVIVYVAEVGMMTSELIEHYRMSIKTLKQCREYIERNGFGSGQHELLAQINVCVSSVTPDFA